MPEFRFRTVTHDSKLVEEITCKAEDVTEAIGIGIRIAGETKGALPETVCDRWLVDIVDEDRHWVMSVPFAMARRSA